MNIIAPLPKKPSTYNNKYWFEQDDEACQELQQILNYSTSNRMEEYTITRTNNPLPNDTSFIIPIHQAVSNLTTRTSQRPRSFSVGDSKNLTFSAISLVH